MTEAPTAGNAVMFAYLGLAGGDLASGFLSKFVDAVGTQPDGKYGAMPADLRRALVVGRAIEEPQPA